MNFLRPFLGEPLTAPEDKAWLWAIGFVVFVMVLGMLAGAARADTRLPHPPGCPPTRFCACGACFDLTGNPKTCPWRARDWLKYPRATPARNTVAVNLRHVFVLKQHVRGNVWLVADYNSGGRKSRLHQRSIAGYAIVDPFAHSRLAGM